MTQASSAFHLTTELSTKLHLVFGYNCSLTKLNLFIKENSISNKLPTLKFSKDRSLLGPV